MDIYIHCIYPAKDVVFMWVSPFMETPSYSLISGGSGEKKHRDRAFVLEGIQHTEQWILADNGTI